MMNAKLFDSLPEEYQTIIVDVFAQMQTRVNEERAEQEAKAVEDMKGNRLLLFTSDWAVRWAETHNDTLELSEFGNI
jgi:TRAP-type C4-dicarboxylate transport system substrate-binding protein